MRTLPKLSEVDTIKGLIVKEYFMTGMDYFDTKYKSSFKMDDMTKNIDDYIKMTRPIREGIEVNISKPEGLIIINLELNV